MYYACVHEQFSIICAIVLQYSGHGYSEDLYVDGGSGAVRSVQPRTRYVLQNILRFVSGGEVKCNTSTHPVSSH